MKYQKKSGRSLMSRYLVKIRWHVTWLATCIGLALGLYAAALSLYIISPPWREGNNMHLTIIFIVVVAILFVVVFALMNRVNNLEKRHSSFRKFGKTMFAKHGQEINTLLKQRAARRIKVKSSK